MKEQYAPETFGWTYDKMREDFERMANEVSLRKEDYDLLVALMRTATSYFNEDPLIESCTIRISCRKALQILEECR